MGSEYKLFQESIVYKDSPVAQMGKNLLARQETRVQSLGQEDPLEEEMAKLLQYSCPEQLMERGAWWVIVHGVAKNLTQQSMHV